MKRKFYTGSKRNRILNVVKLVFITYIKVLIITKTNNFCLLVNLLMQYHLDK